MKAKVKEPPIFHMHVRVAEVAKEGERWLALFEEDGAAGRAHRW